MSEQLTLPPQNQEEPVDPTIELAQTIGLSAYGSGQAETFDSQHNKSDGQYQYPGERFYRSVQAVSDHESVNAGTNGRNTTLTARQQATSVEGVGTTDSTRILNAQTSFPDGTRVSRDVHIDMTTKNPRPTLMTRTMENGELKIKNEVMSERQQRAAARLARISFGLK